MRLPVSFVKILLTAAAIGAVTLPPGYAQEAPTPATVPSAAETASGLAAWAKIVAVLSHPRCSGCHVEDDRPRWSGDHYDGVKVHAFNVQRGADGFGNTGMRCAGCHLASNSNTLHGPPGAPNWHLAPARMVWFGKSSGEICAQLKDPARNGGRTLEAIALHVKDDKLVAWGWAPGEGREPAPGSAEETYQALKRWSAAGAPCPE